MLLQDYPNAGSCDLGLAVVTATQPLAGIHVCFSPALFLSVSQKTPWGNCGWGFKSQDSFTWKSQGGGCHLWVKSINKISYPGSEQILATLWQSPQMITESWEPWLGHGSSCSLYLRGISAQGRCCAQPAVIQETSKSLTVGSLFIGSKMIHFHQIFFHSSLPSMTILWYFLPVVLAQKLPPCWPQLK